MTTPLDFALSDGTRVFCDWQDYPRLIDVPWRCERNRAAPGGFYLMAVIGGIRLMADRYVVSARAGERVVSVDGNPCNLTRANLRVQVCSPARLKSRDTGALVEAMRRQTKNKPGSAVVATMSLPRAVRPAFSKLNRS